MKSVRERQIPYDFTHTCNLRKNPQVNKQKETKQTQRENREWEGEDKKETNLLHVQLEREAPPGFLLNSLLENPSIFLFVFLVPREMTSTNP